MKVSLHEDRKIRMFRKITLVSSWLPRLVRKPSKVLFVDFVMSQCCNAIAGSGYQEIMNESACVVSC